MGRGRKVTVDEWGFPVDGRAVPHATDAGYSRGCRCNDCRMAHREVHREHRARRREVGLNPADPRHGTVSGYTYHGCRCERCLKAGMEGGAVTAWVSGRPACTDWSERPSDRPRS